MLKETPITDPTRNASLRRITREPIHKVAVYINEKLPSVTPDMVTIAGGAFVIGGTFLAESEAAKQNGTIRALATVMKIVGYSADGVDGPLARVKNAQSSRGHLLDYGMDRAEEIHAAFTRSNKATTRRGHLAALSSAVTCTLPGIARAYKESNGDVVAEQGKNPLEFLGTRPGRVATDLLTTVIPSIKGTTDIIGTAANIHATYSRITESRQEMRLTDDKQADAKVRKKMLIATGTAATIGAVALYRK